MYLSYVRADTHKLTKDRLAVHVLRCKGITYIKVCIHQRQKKGEMYMYMYIVVSMTCILSVYRTYLYIGIVSTVSAERINWCDPREHSNKSLKPFVINRSPTCKRRALRQTSARSKKAQPVESFGAVMDQFGGSGVFVWESWTASEAAGGNTVLAGEGCLAF